MNAPDPIMSSITQSRTDPEFFHPDQRPTVIAQPAAHNP